MPVVWLITTLYRQLKNTPVLLGNHQPPPCLREHYWRGEAAALAIANRSSQQYRDGLESRSVTTMSAAIYGILGDEGIVSDCWEMNDNGRMALSYCRLQARAGMRADERYAGDTAFISSYGLTRH